MYSKTFIPYRGYFSSPFARWQGSLQNEHPIELAGDTIKKWLAQKGLDPKIFEYLFLGLTVGQPSWFYAAPWLAALIGATTIPGCCIPQACSTGTTCVGQATLGVETGLYSTVLFVGADRTSNSPHTVWPNPLGLGGLAISENWMVDSFSRDPWGGISMIQTAEGVAKEVKGGVTREHCDTVSVRRYEQYKDALAKNREFQKRYMFPIEYRKAKKEKGLLEEDEGVNPRTKEGVAALKTVIEGGVHTSASQTHPADGNCAIILTTSDKAKPLSADSSIKIQIISYGFGRAPKARMGMAVVPAARMALEKANIGIKDVKAIKTHNPFVVHDIYMAKELGIDVMGFNNYGCPMIFGHPQGPTAGRCIIEMIEELVLLGGGYGLFTGCAAGDTAAALVIKVN